MNIFFLYFALIPSKKDLRVIFDKKIYKRLSTSRHHITFEDELLWKTYQDH